MVCVLIKSTTPSDAHTVQHLTETWLEKNVKANEKENTWTKYTASRTFRCNGFQALMFMEYFSHQINISIVANIENWKESANDSQNMRDRTQIILNWAKKGVAVFPILFDKQGSVTNIKNQQMWYLTLCGLGNVCHHPWGFYL